MAAGKSIADRLDALRAGQTIDALPMSNFLDTHRALIAQGDARWPAWRILLQAALESPDSAIIEAALEWLDARSITTIPALRLTASASPMTERLSLNDVSSACWLSDGILLTAGRSSSLRRRDLITRRDQTFDTPHTTRIQGVRTLGADRAVTWDGLGRLVVWQLGDRSLSVVGELELPTQPNDVIDLGEGRALIWDAAGLVLLRWDTALKQTPIPMPVEPHLDTPGARPFAFDSTHLVTVFEDTIFLGPLDLSFRREAIQLGDRIKGIALLASRLMAWTEAGGLHTWALPLGANLQGRMLHSSAARHAVALGGRQLLTWDAQGIARYWDLDADVMEELPAPAAHPVLSAFALDAAHAVTIDRQQTVTCWSRAGVRTLGQTSADRFTGWSDGRAVGWSAWSSVVEIWSKSGCLATSTHDGLVRAVDTSRAEHLLTIADDAIAFAVDVLATSEVEHFGPLRIGTTVVTEHAGSLLAGDRGGRLAEISLRTGATCAQRRAHSAPISGIIATKESVGTWSADGHIRVWSTAGELIAERRTSASFLGHAAWRADLWISWGVDDTAETPRPCIDIWDRVSGKTLTRLHGMQATPSAVSAVDDAHLLAWSPSEFILWRHGQVAPSLSHTASSPLVDVCWLAGATPRIVALHEDGQVRLHEPSADAITLGRVEHPIRLLADRQHAHLLIVGASDIGVYTPSRPAIRWAPPAGPHLATLALDSGWIVATSIDVRRLDAAAPDQWTWTQPAPRTTRRALALVGQVSSRICLAESSRVLFLDPATGEIESGWQAHAPICPLPLVTDGRAAVRIGDRLVLLEV